MKRLVVGAIIACAVIALFEMLTSISFIFSLILGLIAGGLCVVFLMARSRGEKPETVIKETVDAAKEMAKEPSSTTEERAAHEQLLRACERFVTTYGVGGVHEALQGTVRSLRDILPRAIEFAGNSETTFNLLKLAREDLPRQINAFVDLSVDDRQKTTESFVEQLVKLQDKIGKIASAINSGRRGQYDAESAFINLKF